MREHRLLQPKRSEGRRRWPGYLQVTRPDELWHLDMTSVWVADRRLAPVALTLGRVLTRLPRATYERPDGSKPAAALRLLDLGLRSPKPCRRIVRGVAARLGGARLPALVARYEDRVFLIPRGDPMYLSVFLDDEYEPPACDLLRRLLSPGDCVVDVGANHGWFSLLMAAAVGPSGTVVAVEPMPQMLEALRHNLELNSTLAVRVLPIALGASAGELRLHLFAGLPHGHASISNLGRSDYVTTTARVERTDVALADLEPVLIKVDVEGSELDVLHGADALLTGPRAPSWLIEVNYETSRAMGYSPADLHDYLVSAHNYDLYRVVDGGIVPETDLAGAPHGASWLFVSEHHRDRLKSLCILPPGRSAHHRGRISSAGI